MTDGQVLKATVRIEAPPATVFPYFTDPALIVRWLGQWADLVPEAGGNFALDIGRTPVRGQYVDVDPPRRVVFTWGVPGRESLPPGSTTVEIVLSSDGAGTVVELFHHGLPAGQSDQHREGWSSKLDHLARIFV